MFDRKLIKNAVRDAFLKFDPREQIKNPVMFVVLLGALWVSYETFLNFSFFNVQIAVWLWFTVLFSNFAEAIAEGRGKAQAESLRKARTHIYARRIEAGAEETVPAMDLRKGDLVVCEAGEVIPADGDVVDGVASVDESAITGESAPVIRESGGDHCAVTGGTKVLSDRIVIRISAEPGGGFIDRMIAMVEGAKRQRTPNEIALGILLVAITALFLLVVFTLPSFTKYSETAAGQPAGTVNLSAAVLVSLIVCLIPTTIGALLSAIGISGIDRMIRRNVIATSGRAVEAAGDIDVLLLDKTGTITLGNRMATSFIPAPGYEIKDVAEAAQLASLADETPEGRSVVVLAKEKFDLRARDLAPAEATFIPFTAQTRVSGIDLHNPARSIRKGAAEAIRQLVLEQGGQFPEPMKSAVENISKAGGTPLVVSENDRVLGVIELKDVVKGGIKERFAQLRQMGIRTVMITGDNPLTAAAIAAEAGVDDFMAEATPEQKLARIRQEQAGGHLVAMNTGTQAAREAGNMVDLDSNPTKLIEVVEIGKQLLMTRGALTTFSIANDVAKYFAILPAMFATLYATSTAAGPLAQFNIMGLHSPQSAILSAVIFNALIIIALIPLALRGVKYRATGAVQVLTRNAFIYGLGGVIAPFIGIKLVDILVVALHLA
ncbi:MAG: potassium-transporting ATPase subunit KdpB [Chthoniobacterales bacterium]